MITATALPRRFFLLLTAALALALAGGTAGCRAPMRDDRPTLTWSLTGTVWKLVSLNGNPVGANKLPSLTLDAATGKASGMAGVNRFNGTFKQEGSALSFGPLITTRMAGPENEMKIESEFLTALGHVTTWKADGLVLILLAGEKEVARFQGLPAGAPLD
jgi:heat shock protein HslJ